MTSTNKTQYVDLNQWVESDIPQMSDFNNDNEIIDNVIKELDINIENHKNNNINPHKTTAEQVGAYDKAYIDDRLDSKQGAISSICGMANAKGNINITGGTGIQVLVDENNKNINIVATGESAPVDYITKSLSITLASNSWSGNEYTVNNSALTGTSVVELYPSTNITDDQLEILQEANIIGGNQSTGKLKLIAKGEVPTTNIPVTLLIRGDILSVI